MFARLRSLIQNFNPKERRLLYVAIFIFCIAAIAFSFRLYYRFTVEIPDYGGEYIEGLYGQPTIINPILLSGNEVDRDLSNLLFNDLVTLSEDIKHSEDGRIWTLTLKKDLKWSDNEPLTSDDVIYTLDAIQDLNTRSPLILIWQGVVAERLSEREIKFTLKAPYAFFENILQNFKIIPRHIFSNIPNNNLRLSNFNLEPVGSGPYTYSHYDKRKDGFITDYYLTKNPNFSGSAPYITNFRISFVQNINTAIDRFNTLTLSGFGKLTEDDISKLKTGFNAHKIPLSNYYAIFFNSSTHQALKESSIKEALALATDRDAVINAGLKGQAIPVFGPILPHIEGYNASIYKDEVFSIEKATEILDKSGWTQGEDGVREKMIGKIKTRLEFELIVPQIPEFITAVNILKDNWAKIGIKTIVISINPSEIYDAVIKTRKYNMLFFGNIANDPDIRAFWHSSEKYFPGLNLSIYDNKKADALLESIRKDLNKETRIQNIEKLQQLILADHPAIFLFSTIYNYVSAKTLKGFSADNINLSSDRFGNVNQWYIKTKRVLKKD